MGLQSVAKYNRCSCYHVASRYINMAVRPDESASKALINPPRALPLQRTTVRFRWVDSDLNNDIYNVVHLLIG